MLTKQQSEYKSLHFRTELYIFEKLLLLVHDDLFRAAELYNSQTRSIRLNLTSMDVRYWTKGKISNGAKAL